MSRNEARQASQLLTSTGEPSLDNLLGGSGYPDKSAVLIAGGAGSGKEILGYRFIQSGLRLGDFCLYVTRSSVREVLEDAKGSGFEFQNGLLFWISSEGGQVKYEPSDLIKLSFRIKEVLKKNSERKTRIVLDVCSPLLMLYPPDTIYKFLDQLFADVKQYDAILLATFEEGMHPQNVLAAMQQLFDGVIEFRLTGKGENQFYVKKMRGIKLQSVATKQVPAYAQGNVQLEEIQTRLDRHRIAILPFANISPDPNDVYFADGITEELIATISKIRELQVIARTSVIRYKDEKKSANEIGNELKVGCLLEGSVRKAGEKLRITVQLIDSQTSDHLWSESYDRELKDVFAIQSEVAERVAGVLQVQLLNDVIKRIEKKPTNSQEAHSLYLKGLQCENEFTEGGFAKALQYFNLAVSADPNYAQPCTAIVSIYFLSAIFGYVRFDEVREKAQVAAFKGIELDSDSAEARLALSMFKMTELDFAGAEAESRRSVDLDASYSEGIHFHSFQLLILGRRKEALMEARKRAELDPLSLEAKLDVGWMLYENGQFDDSINHLKKIIEMDPYFHSSHMYLGSAYFAASRFDEAIAEFQEAIRLTEGREFRFVGYLGEAYARKGNEAEARKIIRMLEESSAKRPIADEIAMIYLALGDLDKAFLWTSKAIEEKNPFFLGGLNVESEWDSARSDPRFVALLAKVKGSADSSRSIISN